MFFVFSTAYSFYQNVFAVSRIFLTFFIFHHSVISRAIYILSCRSCFVNTFLSFFLSFCLHPTVSDKSASDERRRRDLNPRAAVNDLHPFQGCPFGQLGYFSSRIFFIFIFLNIHLKKMNGESGIRTHAPLRTNGFQDRLVMTTSISLHMLLTAFVVFSPPTQVIF